MLRSVLHISESDGSAGAGALARGLHEGLRDAGLRSRMLVGRRHTDDPDIKPLKRGAWRALDFPFVRAAAGLDLQYAFYPSSFGVAADRWYREAQILQLHNLHGSFFSFTALPLLTRRPTVWWIQDMWPFTGHVAYSYGCERWRIGCGECPLLHEYPALRRDRTRLLWRLKRATYQRANFTIVTSSRWLDGLVGESPLLSRYERALIPQAVDLEVFRPRPRQEALARLGLRGLGDAPTVLLIDGEDRKGAGLIPALLAELAREASPLTVLVVGTRGSWQAPVGIDVRELGLIGDRATLGAAFSAADVFVLPTRADNLPSSMLEALASGTPVVGSRVGGVPDAVHHLGNGYLAEPDDVAEFARGVWTLLREPGLLERARVAARRTAEGRFGIEQQTRAFTELYSQLVANSAGVGT